MEKETNKKETNKKAIVIAGIAVVAVVVIAVILLLTTRGKDAYRILKVFEVEGEAFVTRTDVGELEPYANMVLESGDTVRLNTGLMTIQADGDKYIYLEEQTELVLEASGTDKDSKTTIVLKEGAITNDIQNPLSEDSTYEINTPNSTMSVRGTTFRVAVYTDENGVQYTRVSVFDGKVETALLGADGSVSDPTFVEKGKEVIIYDDGTVTDYVGDIQDIDFSTLPKEVIELLIEMIDEGMDIGVTKEDLEGYLDAGPFTVTFMYNGTVFGTQEVNRDAYATKPMLMPEASGSWDFDFNTPITADVEIEWK